MIGEKICIRRVGLFIFLATLLCSWDVVCFQGKKTAKEATLSYLVDLASLYTDEDTAQMLWANCRDEMVRVKDTVEELDVCSPHIGSDSFNYNCKLEEKEKYRMFFNLLYPELKLTLIDCLRKNGLPFRVSGEEFVSSNWFTFSFERLTSFLATHRRSLESHPGVAEGPEPSPAFPDVSEASTPPSPTSQDSLNGPISANSSKGDGHEKIIIAVVATACVTFFFALVVFICFYKVFRSGPQSGPNDGKPLLGQSMNYSSSGSPYSSFVYGGPFKEENLNSQSPDHKSKVSSLHGTGAIEADALKQSFGRPSVGSSYGGGLKVELQAYRLSEEGSSMPLKPPPGRLGSSLKPPLGRSPSVLHPPPGRNPSMKPPPIINSSVLKLPPTKNPSVLKLPPTRNPSVLKPPPPRADPLPHEPPAPPKPPSTVVAPPPPPPLAPRPTTGSVGPRNPASPPPPAPPGPGGRAPGPPPPPPPKGGGAGPRPPPQPIGRGGQPPPVAPGAADDCDGPKTKLKPFFWDKVLANPGHSMVWHQIKGGSFQFNEEMIESLFGYNVVDKAKKETKKEFSAQESSSTVVQIIDSKKSQNLAILLRALNVTIEEVRDAIIEGNELPVEFLQTVLKMAPTADEELKLRLYNGELSQLGPADRFLKVMVNIPFAFKRMDALLFMSSLQEELAFAKEAFSTLEVACQELKNSRLFLKLLEAVLKTGNRMNSGTFRGGAQAFKLDTLLKLSDVKGTDAKTTLLHFVVQEIIRSEGVRVVRVAKESNHFFSIEESGTEDEEEYYRNLGLQIVSGLGGELGNVKKAAIIDADTLTGSVARLSFSLMKAQDLLNTDLKNLEEESNFQRALKSFVQNAETNIFELMEEEKRIMGLVKRTGDYFHGNSAKDEGLKLFVVVRDFLVMLDKSCRVVKDAPPMRPSKPVQKKEDGPNLAPSVSDSSLASPASSDLRKRLFPAIQDRRHGESSSSDEDS